MDRIHHRTVLHGPAGDRDDRREGPWIASGTRRYTAPALGTTGRTEGLPSGRSRPPDRVATPVGRRRTVDQPPRGGLRPTLRSYPHAASDGYIGRQSRADGVAGAPLQHTQR